MAAVMATAVADQPTIWFNSINSAAKCGAFHGISSLWKQTFSADRIYWRPSGDNIQVATSLKVQPGRFTWIS